MILPDGETILEDLAVKSCRSDLFIHKVHDPLVAFPRIKPEFEFKPPRFSPDKVDFGALATATPVRSLKSFDQMKGGECFLLSLPSSYSLPFVTKFVITLYLVISLHLPRILRIFQALSPKLNSIAHYMYVLSIGGLRAKIRAKSYQALITFISYR